MFIGHTADQKYHVYWTHCRSKISCLLDTLQIKNIMFIGHTADQKSENLLGSIMKTTFFQIFFCFTSREECAPKPREETKTGENKIKLR